MFQWTIRNPHSHRWSEHTSKHSPILTRWPPSTARAEHMHILELCFTRVGTNLLAAHLYVVFIVGQRGGPSWAFRTIPSMLCCVLMTWKVSALSPCSQPLSHYCCTQHCLPLWQLEGSWLWHQQHKKCTLGALTPQSIYLSYFPAGAYIPSSLSENCQISAFIKSWHLTFHVKFKASSDWSLKRSLKMVNVHQVRVRYLYGEHAQWEEGCGTLLPRLSNSTTEPFPTSPALRPQGLSRFVLIQKQSATESLLFNHLWWDAGLTLWRALICAALELKLALRTRYKAYLSIRRPLYIKAPVVIC